MERNYLNELFGIETAELVESEITIEETPLSTTLEGKGIRHICLSLHLGSHLELKDSDNPENIKQFVIKDRDSRIVGWITLTL